MQVDGKAESDADIMASLRNRTAALGDDDVPPDDAPDDDDVPPPPPPPAPKKRMTMAEKIAAKQSAMQQNKTKGL